jgi:hypothetical protein
MDISSEIIKSHSNKDFISSIVPGAMLLAICALFLHVFDVVEIVKWIEPKQYLFEFLAAYICGMFLKMLYGNIFGKLFGKSVTDRRMKKIFCIRKLNAYNYYLRILAKQFEIEDSFSSVEHHTICYQLSSDLVDQKQLKVNQDQESLIDLMCGFIINLTIFIILLIIGMFSGHLLIPYLHANILLTFFLTICTFVLYENLVSVAIIEYFNVISQAGMYLRLKDDNLFANPFKPMTKDQLDDDLFKKK